MWLQFLWILSVSVKYLSGSIIAEMTCCTSSGVLIVTASATVVLVDDVETVSGNHSVVNITFANNLSLIPSTPSQLRPTDVLRERNLEPHYPTRKLHIVAICYSILCSIFLKAFYVFYCSLPYYGLCERCAFRQHSKGTENTLNTVIRLFGWPTWLMPYCCWWNIDYSTDHLSPSSSAVCYHLHLFQLHLKPAVLS